MEGWWDCPRLDEFFARLLRSGVEGRLRLTPGLAFRALGARIFNFQTRARSREVIDRHYDLGNDLFQAMLDPGLNYSCGYWKGARNLEEAQAQKLDLVCQKLMLKPGMRLLDIGWHHPLPAAEKLRGGILPGAPGVLPGAGLPGTSGPVL